MIPGFLIAGQSKTASWSMIKAKTNDAGDIPFTRSSSPDMRAFKINTHPAALSERFLYMRTILQDKTHSNMACEHNNFVNEPAYSLRMHHRQVH